jgi:hypothetical protein
MRALRFYVTGLLLACALWYGAGAGYQWSTAARAEVLGSPSISSTSTSATVQLARSVRDLTLINDSASANEAYLRVFWCGEPTLAATTSSPIRLQPGESISFTIGPSDGGNGGYCAFSHVCDTAETATLRYVAK